MTDGFSSLTNRLEGMQIAMERRNTLLPRFVEVVEQFVTNIQSVVEAAHERGQVPEIDPHRSIYATVEAIGGIAYYREYRDACMAVPFKLRPMPSVAANGGRQSGPMPRLRLRRGSSTSIVWRVRAIATKESNSFAFSMSHARICFTCAVGPASVRRVRRLGGVHRQDHVRLRSQTRGRLNLPVPPPTRL